MILQKCRSPGISLFVLAMLLANCRKNDKLVPTLVADKTLTNVPAGAGKEYLQVDANTDWELTGMPAWLTVTPSSGNRQHKVELTVHRQHDLRRTFGKPLPSLLRVQREIPSPLRCNRPVRPT